MYRNKQYHRLDYYSADGKTHRFVLDPVLEILNDIAEKDDNIRAVLLRGSHATMDHDYLSDRDVTFVTNIIKPDTQKAILKKLVREFGEVALIRVPKVDDASRQFIMHIQFRDGKKDYYGTAICINLAYQTKDCFDESSYEDPAVVLLAKEDDYLLTKSFPKERGRLITRPEADEFVECCNSFWWNAPIVYKAEQRGNRVHALETLSESVRPEFVKMMTWLAGARSKFQFRIGTHSLGIGAYVPEYSKPLLLSYSDTEGIRNALFELVYAFPQLASETAKLLGYEYNKREGDNCILLLETHLGRHEKAYGLKNKDPKRILGAEKVITHTYSNAAEVFGVNIFDYKWMETGEKVDVVEPLGCWIWKDFEVYSVEINGIIHKFAADETSNTHFVFYSVE